MTEMEKAESISFNGYPPVSIYLSMLESACHQSWWSSSGITLLVCVAVGGALILKDSVPLLVVLPAMLVLGGIIAGSVWLGTALSTRDRRKAYNKAVTQEPRTGWVDKDGIHLQIQNGRTDLQWSYFTQIIDTKDAIGLCKDKQLVDCFSASMFSTPEQWYRAKQMITEGMK